MGSLGWKTYGPNGKSGMEVLPMEMLGVLWARLEDGHGSYGKATKRTRPSFVQLEGRLCWCCLSDLIKTACAVLSYRDVFIVTVSVVCGPVKWAQTETDHHGIVDCHPNPHTHS